MELTELFYPQFAVEIGSYYIEQGVEIEIFSSQDSYFDWAKVRFTEQYKPKLSFEKKTPSVIQLGYGGSFEEVFIGYVSQGYDGGGFMNEVNLKDDMVLLEETFINNTFLNTTPQEMISYFLKQAGVTDFKLSVQIYPERKQVPIRKMTVIQAINAVHAAWGINKKFFFSGGVFYWDEKPKQTMIYTFEYGVNILTLSRISGVWELETVSVPFVKHSHTINVVHPQVNGTFEVKKVVTATNDSGFIRTKIYF